MQILIGFKKLSLRETKLPKIKQNCTIVWCPQVLSFMYYAMKYNAVSSVVVFNAQIITIFLGTCKLNKDSKNKEEPK